jgi:hypothetical protein
VSPGALVPSRRVNVVIEVEGADDACNRERVQVEEEEPPCTGCGGVRKM